MKPLDSLNHGFESTAHLNGSYGENACEFSGSKSNGQKVFYFVYDFQINDLPEPVRNLLIKQVTLEEISCYSGTNIKVLGSFVPTERKDNQVGPKPLYLHIQASKKQNIDRAVQRIKVQIQQAMNLPKYKEKVLIGLEAAPAAFDVRGKVLGPGGANLQYITHETGAIVTLRGRGSGFIEPTTGLESIEPLHLCVEHNKYDVLQAGRQLAFNLIETVQQEWYNYQQQNQPANTPSVPQHMNTQQQGWQEKSSESRYNKECPPSSQEKPVDLYDPGADSDGEADDYRKRNPKRWEERSSRDHFQRSSSRGGSSGKFGSEENIPDSSDARIKRPGIPEAKYPKRMKENGFESSNRGSDPAEFNLSMGNASGIQSAGPLATPLNISGAAIGIDVRAMGGQQQHGGGVVGGSVPGGFSIPPFVTPQFANPVHSGMANNIVITGNNQFYPPVKSIPTSSSEPQLETSTDFNLAIVSEKYPDKTISQENFEKFLDRVNTLITQMDPKREKVYPAFKSIKLENGILCVVCKTEETKKWLERSLPLCTIDWDVGLRVMNPSYLPNLVHMMCNLPGPKPQPDILLKQLSNQNSHIDVSKWGLASITENKNSNWAVFTMDDSQGNALARNKFILSYRFEEITLRQVGTPKPHNWFKRK